MARQVNDIYQQQLDEKANQTALSGLTSTSQVAIWSNLLYTFAVECGLHEQAWDIFIAEIEAGIAKAGAGTLPWIRDRILEFQAGDNVEYNNGVIAYPVIDTTKQIITRCSVVQDLNRTVSAKVAKSDPPTPLSAAEQTELEYYIKQIQFAGTQINVINQNSDKLYILGTIYYDGQYANTVQADVITALNNYCAGLSSATNFNGIVKVIDIEAAIKAVVGVTNLKLSQVAARPDGTTWAGRSIVYDLPTGVNALTYATQSGYIVQETTAGETFSDTLTFTASS